MITLQTNLIRAVIHCAAKKDVRYYLQGALLEVCTNGDVHLVSTDGHCLFAGLIAAPNVRWVGQPQSGPWQMTIPLETLKVAGKSKKPTVDLCALPDGRYTLGDVLFTPVDGRFPDWRRVSMKVQGAELSPAQYDPDLLAKCSAALKEWFNPKGRVYAAHLSQHGTDSGIMTGDDYTAYCLVMPWRTVQPVDKFTPAAY